MQGAVLSPILYAAFTNDLLYELEHSHLGAHINSIYCGAPTYADDMSLISHSEHVLQEMLNIVSGYALKWQLFCNRPSLRPKNPSWSVCGNVIPVSDTAKHLGILLSSASSTIARTTERITSSRSAFYALSAIGARHSCINPLTSLRLYKAISLPILTFGLDVWSPTNTELSMMERSQVKILRTILGLPVRTSTAGIHSLLGTVPIHYTAQVKLLSFVRSTLALPPTATARLVLLFRARQLYPPPGSFIHKIVATLDHLCLPDVDSLSSDVPSKSAWKALVKTMVHESFREDLTASSLHPTLSDVSRISPPNFDTAAL